MINQIKISLSFKNGSKHQSRLGEREGFRLDYAAVRILRHDRRDQEHSGGHVSGGLQNAARQRVEVLQGHGLPHQEKFRPSPRRLLAHCRW